MIIRITNGELKNCMFDVYKFSKDKKEVEVWNSDGSKRKIDLTETPYDLFGFEN